MHTPKHESDWLLDSLLWSIKRAAAVFVLIVLLGLMADFAFTSFDVYGAELKAKENAARVYNMYCNSAARAEGISATVLQECARQKAVMERNAWTHTYHVAGEHMQEHIPGVAYCNARPDMCALSWLKFLELMKILVYWVPLIFGSALLWYAWPVIAGMCLRRAMTPQAVVLKPAPPMPDDKTD